MKEILTVYQQYTGVGFLTILYLLTLIYLWIAEKNITLRSIFVYGASIIQFLFFVPLFFYGYRLLDEGTYYRILWILPMTITIAYATVGILSKYPSTSTIVGLLMIVLCGKYVYNSVYIMSAENLYHIPQEAVEICEMIMPEEDEENVKGIFPDDLVHFIRQYSARIKMVYGRDYLAPDWKYGDHPVRETINSGRITAFRLASLANKEGCHYIILERDKIILGDLSKFDIDFLGETDNYHVYRNSNVMILQK